MSFCFVLNNPVAGIETCQELNELVEQIGKSRAINCKRIHFVVNTCACCEGQGVRKLPFRADPNQFADSVLLNPNASLSIS